MEVVANTSGQGASALVPEEIKGWNWGAFFLNAIWSIAMQTWIGLLALIPCVNLIMVIVLGLKGNEWAWQNRKWESVEQFKTVQGIWTKWGVTLILAAFVLGIVMGVISGIIASMARSTG